MFGLLKRTDPAISALIGTIEVCREEIPDDLKFYTNPLLDQLAKAAKNLWSADHIDNYKASLASGEIAEGFIYNYLFHTTANALGSGKYHIYRGVLSAEGARLKSLLSIIIEAAVKKKIYTNDWAQEHLMKAVNREIAQCG